MWKIIIGTKRMSEEIALISTFRHKALFIPVMFIFGCGCISGLIVCPLIMGFKLGMADCDKFWKFPQA